ncbi:fatty acid synthase-like [Panonychus citri]|uniref:fatty acid synthase-like n=1 Tax=Panonychus citri TaxID=50023 RepID=UPI00230715CF|nr:fatty acid synthase-like [Panonychus citri]
MSTSQSRPIWFIFPGLEAYDPTPPISVLTFPPFVKLCDSLNEKTGFNLLETIVNEGSSPSLATVFATITTLQTSLIHLLASLGITPDGFIGYGIGEFAASYMDGCYDAETVIFLSHTIGRKIDDSGYRRGAMALVHQDESKFSSFFSNSGVTVSAHNTENCITIAGSQKNIDQVLEKLKMDKIKCSPIASYSTALHCSQMDYLKDTAMESLYRLIDSPKPRSHRWVSTTVAATEDCLRLSCPRYFLRNLTSPVLFREACSELPANAIIIEVNYRSILESFVKSNLKSPETIIYLTIPCLNNMDTTKSQDYQLFNTNIINNNNNNVSTGMSTDKLVDYLLKERQNTGVYEVR